MKSMNCISATGLRPMCAAPAAAPTIAASEIGVSITRCAPNCPRKPSVTLKAPPYTPAFAQAFPRIITFVGTLDAVVTNEDGEQLRLLTSDLAHEVLTPDSFASTNPIHAFIVDAAGRVRDRASLTGRVNIDRTTGEAVHRIVDRGTCHQTADLNLGPGTDRVTVFGPFFVLPFNTTVVVP